MNAVLRYCNNNSGRSFHACFDKPTSPPSVSAFRTSLLWYLTRCIPAVSPKPTVSTYLPKQRPPFAPAGAAVRRASEKNKLNLTVSRPEMPPLVFRGQVTFFPGVPRCVNRTANSAKRIALHSTDVRIHVLVQAQRTTTVKK